MRIIATLALAAALAAAAPAARYRADGPALLPDPEATPGDVATLDTARVCVHGYTRTVRDVPAAVAAAAYAEYGAAKKPGVCCEVDHLISLELGGSNDLKNLWPQPYLPRPGAREKDRLENYLHERVCAGRESLGAAQYEIRTDWYAAYLRMPAPEKSRK